MVLLIFGITTAWRWLDERDENAIGVDRVAASEISPRGPRCATTRQGATMIPQALEAAVSRVVSPDELRLALESTIPVEEREEVLQLVRWFTTRYASGEARLAYVHRAVARWQRTRTKDIS